MSKLLYIDTEICEERVIKLIKDLGIKNKKRWGLYECPSCLKHFETCTYYVTYGGSTQCRECGHLRNTEIEISKDGETIVRRKCNDCGEKKDLNKFYKKLKGVSAKCKKCSNKDNLCRSRTKHGLVVQIYYSQKTSSKKRGHTPPAYSFEDFKDWLTSQKKFHHLYHLWKVSNYDRWLKPSVDRKRDEEGYTFSNIQLMTWKENSNKKVDEIKCGEKTTQQKIILQYDIEGNLIMEYHSRNEASRVTGIHKGNIGSCANGKKITAGGFKWEYK